MTAFEPAGRLALHSVKLVSGEAETALVPPSVLVYRQPLDAHALRLDPLRSALGKLDPAAQRRPQVLAREQGGAPSNCADPFE